MSPGYSSLNLVFLGPPGCGKGTQAKYVAEQYELPHISTGDMLRAEARRGTAIGRQVAGVIARGELVDDALLRSLVLHRLDQEDCVRGFLLDGYPRSVAQAGLLDDILAELGRSIERVILLEVADEVIVARLGGRWVHEPSGRVYHEVHNPPREPGRDDATGEPLVRLPDDGGQAVRERLRNFHHATAPLAELYRRRGLLIEVDGDRPHAEVAEAVMQAIGAPVGA